MEIWTIHGQVYATKNIQGSGNEGKGTLSAPLCYILWPEKEDAGSELGDIWNTNTMDFEHKTGTIHGSEMRDECMIEPYVFQDSQLLDGVIG